MALNKTYFETKGRDVSVPIPDTPGYTPPSPPTPPSPGSGSTPYIPRPTFTGNIEIDFYISSSDDDVLNKNITSVTSKTVTIKEEVNLLDFTIPFNDTALLGINYAKVLDRYYFCELILNAGQLTDIRFKVDPLMSWKDNLVNISAIVERTGRNYNTYLPDNEVKITAYNNIHRLESTSGFSQALKYYLLAVGDSGQGGA